MAHLQGIHGKWLAENQLDVLCCFRQLQKFSNRVNIIVKKFYAKLDENAYNNRHIRSNLQVMCHIIQFMQLSK